MPPLGSRFDPLPAFRFRIDIDAAGVGAIAAPIEAGCMECGGLHVETEVLEYREGGLNGYAHHFVGATKWAPLVLKRGLSMTIAFWEWYSTVRTGIVMRRNGSICLLDTAGYEKVRWDFIGAFPVKWSGPDLRAETAGLAFETIELVHQGFTMRVLP